jgi:ribosomal protein L29
MAKARRKKEKLRNQMEKKQLQRQNYSMAILRIKDIVKMNDKEFSTKLKDLKTELIKANIKGKTSGSKSNIREIKRTIAKILTIKKLNKIKGAKKQ